MSRRSTLRHSRKRHVTRRRHARRHLRRNAKKPDLLMVGALALGAAAILYVVAGNKKKKEPGVFPPGTGEIVYVPPPSGGKPVPATTQVAPPADAGMPDWMKAAIAAGALIPGTLPGTLIVNAAYDWMKSGTPWWQKAGIAAGFLVPGAAFGTMLMNAVYDWWKS